MQCETIDAIAQAICISQIEPGVHAYLTELIERARIVTAPRARSKLRLLSLASTRQLYRDIQSMLEPPVLSWSLLTQIARADLALAALSPPPKRHSPFWKPGG